MHSLTLLILLCGAVLFLVVILSSKRNENLIIDRTNSLPEIIDLIISGLQAGMSITETLANLGKIGPTCTKQSFLKFEANLRNDGNFQRGIDELKGEFKDPLADQLFETLIYASKFGGRNAIKILQELSEYVANDISLRSEILARFSWVQNSAVLAAAAPWLLYLILRTQENARIAYSQPIGQIFMLLGFFLTTIAYFWMRKIARLPRAKRIFITNPESPVLY
jgi:tight adherence protein B